jgi:hypothetical protein
MKLNGCSILLEGLRNEIDAVVKMNGDTKNVLNAEVEGLKKKIEEMKKTLSNSSRLNS